MVLNDHFRGQSCCGMNNNLEYVSLMLSSLLSAELRRKLIILYNSRRNQGSHVPRSLTLPCNTEGTIKQRARCDEVRNPVGMVKKTGGVLKVVSKGRLPRTATADNSETIFTIFTRSDGVARPETPVGASVVRHMKVVACP